MWKVPFVRTLEDLQGREISVKHFYHEHIIQDKETEARISGILLAKDFHSVRCFLLLIAKENDRERDEEWRCINDEFYYSASQLPYQQQTGLAFCRRKTNGRHQPQIIMPRLL